MSDHKEIVREALRGAIVLRNTFGGCTGGNLPGGGVCPYKLAQEALSHLTDTAALLETIKALKVGKRGGCINTGINLGLDKAITAIKEAQHEIPSSNKDA